MFERLEEEGFLGAGGSLGADISLVVSLLAAVLLTIGIVLAKRHRYGAHRWVQTSAAALNAVPVLAWMVRSFAVYVLPELPSALSEQEYLVTVVHAAVGALGLALGAVVVIASNLREAQGRSLAGWVMPMRAAYAAYILGTAFGVWTYVAIYG